MITKMKQEQSDHNSRPERRTPYIIYRIFALLAAGLGLLALFGWIAGLPLLTTFVAGWIPMAPSTALLLLLYGTAIFFHTRMQQSPGAYRIGLTFGWSVTAVSLLLLVLSSLGIRPAVEHLGIHIAGTVDGVMIGHMSPVTASCFALTGLSFLVLLSSFSGPKWRSVAASGLASLVVWSGITLLLAYLFGTPVFYSTTLIPPALPTSLGFLMLGTSLLVSSGQRTWLRNALSDTSSRRTTYVLVVTLVLLATGVITAGYLHFRSFERNYRTEVENELSAIADLKTEELANWREDYLKDAAVLFKNPSFHALSQRYLENPGDADVERQLQTWLGLFPDRFHFDQVRLIDTQGVTRMLVPAGLSTISSAIREVIPEVLRPGQVKLKDFYFCDYCQKVHLAVLVPILDETDGDRPVGVLALRIDPTTYLYPLIRKWPTPSQTAEALIVRREGNDVVFLNDLRFRENTALRLRFSLDGNKEFPAVKAVLGQEGIVEGVDYRGVPVIAAVRTVPNSPWSLVVRMDISEVYASVRERMWMMFGLVGILLLGAGAVVGLAWQQRRLQFSREQHKADEALRESEERHRQLVETLQEGIWTIDKDANTTFVNRHLAAMLGYTIEEMQGKRLFSFMDEHGIEIAKRLLERRAQGIKEQHDFEFLRKDGSRVYAILETGLLTDKSGKYIGAIAGVVDVTERKRAEEALEEAKTRYQEIFNGIHEGIGIVDENEIIRFANPAFACIFEEESPEVLIGRSILDFMPEDQRTIVLEQTGQRRERNTSQYELAIVTRRGTRKTIFASVSPRLDTDGRFIGSFGAVLDVTERKQAAEALRESREILGAVLNSIPVRVFWKDKNLTYLGCNTQFAQDAGFERPEDLIGRDDHAMGWREQAELYRGDDRDVIESGKAKLLIEEPQTTSSGEQIHLLTSKVPLRDARGEIIGVLGTYQDITERKHAEQALRESELRFRELAELLPQTVYELDPTGRLTYSNNFGFKSTGYTQTDIDAGLNALAMVSTGDRERCAEAMQQVIAGTRRGADEYTMRRKDGTEFPAIVYSAQILSDGQVVGIRGLVADITERKRAEEALRKSEALSRAVVDKSPIGIAIRDAEGKLLGVNDAWMKIWGVAQEEVTQIINRSTRESNSALDCRQIRQWSSQIEGIYRRGGILHIPELYYDGDPAVRSLWISLTYYSIMNGQGQVDRVVVLTTDIGDRKQAEEKLKQLSLRHETLLESVPDIIMEVDSNKVYTWANMAGYEFFGDDVIGKEATHYFEGEQTTYQTVQPLFGGHEDVIYVESWQRRRDGEKRLLAWWCKVRKDTEGNVTGALSTARDITEQKRAEEALQIAEEKYRTLINNVPVSVFRSTPDGRVLSVNPAAVRMMGYDSEEEYCAIPGRDSYVDPHRRQELLDALQKHGFVTDFESQMIRKDGTVIWVSANATAHKNESGEIEYIDGTEEDVTELKLAHEALEESEERYRQIVEASPFGMHMYQLEPNGRLVFEGANPAADWILRIDHSRLKGKTIEEAFPSLTGTEIPEQYRMIARHGERWRTENIAYEEGKIKGAFEVVAFQRSPMKMAAVFKDITERKRAEEALRTAEEHYRMLFEGAGEGVLVAQDGRIVLCNPAWTAISGYSPEELGRVPFTEFIHPDDRELVADRYRLRIAGEDVPTGYDFRIIAKSGDVRQVRIDTTVINWNGCPATLSFLADVTERRQAEEEIRKFKTISDNASYGTQIISLDATFLYVNRAFAEMHGYTPEELIGRQVSSCHTEEQMISVSANIDVFRSGGFTSHEVWHLHRNGTEFLTLMSGTVIRDASGQPQYMASTTVDITELKRLQELADRAHRLEAAGRIAGQVAHDFNNLLGPLVAYPGLIRDELGDSHPVNAYLEPMESAAQQMADINQQLLTLGRRGHYILEPLDLNQVIRQVLEQIQPQYASLAVVSDLAADLMHISGGVAQIARVMTNLITNAVDAMQGVGTLTITAENWYAEEAQGIFGQIARGEYAKVTISDTGCGMPEDILQHVFEPFFSTKKADRKRGSGLGLSVVHAVVEDHHGYIDIDSVMGKGTAIYLYFPITREEVVKEDESSLQGGHESVLIVDDDATQREVTLKLLQTLGYRAEAVNGGEAALQRLQSESFDLLILDMVMPGGCDGADTFKRAKELHPDQRAIIVSGFAESDRVSEAQQMGAGAFVKKPLTQKSLAAAVRCELDRERVIETVR